MGWQFVVTDRQGNALGELQNASGRSLRFALNRLKTFAFTVTVDNPMSQHLVQGDQTLVKAYEDSTGSRTLRLNGPVVTFEKARSAQAGTLAVTVADAGWRLGHRLIGKHPAGATFGTPVALIDRGEIAGQILDAVNNGNTTTAHADSGDTGVRRGTITASSQTFAGPWRYKPANEAISELSAPLDGYDWEIAPTEPTPDAIGLQIGALNIAAAFGSVKPDAVWEFGTGRHNVAEFRDVGDSGSLANRAHNLPPGFPDNATQQVVTASDQPSIDARGLHETVVAGDLQVDALRQNLVDEHVRIRRFPRRVITFTPISENPDASPGERRVPRLWSDYGIGDVVPFRAVERFEVRAADGAITDYQQVKTVDALFRVYAVEVQLDNNGVVTPTLTLVEEG